MLKINTRKVHDVYSTQSNLIKVNKKVNNY